MPPTTERCTHLTANLGTTKNGRWVSATTGGRNLGAHSIGIEAGILWKIDTANRRISAVGGRFVDSVYALDPLVLCSPHTSKAFSRCDFVVGPTTRSKRQALVKLSSLGILSRANPGLRRLCRRR